MVSPDEKTEYRDRDQGPCHERVAEDLFPSKGRDDLADHAEARQDHDVNRRVAVEPEQVLEQQRVTTVSRVEDPDLEQPFDRHEDNRDRQYGGTKDEDQARRIVSPDEQGQAKPGHPGSPHRVDCHDEIQARQDR